MTTQSKPASEFTSGVRPCTPEEEEELQRLDWEFDRNAAHRDAKLDRLIEEHRGQYAMFYCDDQGESQLVVAADQRRLYQGIRPERLQAAVVELLDDRIELAVPHALLDLG